MPFPYKNPINATQLSGPDSVPRNVTYGTNFSVLEIGGYMEVYSLQDLIYTIPYAVEGGAVEQVPEEVHGGHRCCDRND